MITYGSVAKGSAAEDAALAFLQSQGLRCVARNFRCKMGEIDLIMQQGNLLIFVEVRLRQTMGYHSGAESISTAKIGRLLRTAEFYLASCRPADSTEYRFDVVSIGAFSEPSELSPSVAKPQAGNRGRLSCLTGDNIDWIQAAFTADR
jgi:putative endonuclease